MSGAIVHHIPDVTVRYDLLCPHSQEAKILVVARGGRYQLPFIEPTEHHTAIVDHIERLFFDKYRLVAVAVRILSYQHEEEQKEQFRLYQMANWQGWHEVPAGYHWLAEHELDQLDLAHEAYQQQVENWFGERTGRLPIPEKRVPWARQGWYRRICGWIEEQLVAVGYEVKQITLYRAWGISAGIWVESDKGRIYVKVSPPQFQREAGVTAFLARQDPGHFPDVIAINVGEGWLMMLASQADPLVANADLAAWQGALTDYARQQQESRAYQQQLGALGCKPRSLAGLADALNGLLADERCLRPEPAVAFSAAEMSRLKQLMPELTERCRYWSEHGLTETLVHGDFHPGNVLSGAEGPIFIDWSDACWSHPFMDIIIFMLEEFSNPAIGPSEMERLVESYLGGWVGEKRIERLRQEYEALRPLAILFHALTYAGIVANFEESARWEMHNVVPWMLRQLLAAFD